MAVNRYAKPAGLSVQPEFYQLPFQEMLQGVLMKDRYQQEALDLADKSIDLFSNVNVVPGSPDEAKKAEFRSMYEAQIADWANKDLTNKSQEVRRFARNIANNEHLKSWESRYKQYTDNREAIQKASMEGKYNPWQSLRYQQSLSNWNEYDKDYQLASLDPYLNVTENAMDRADKIESVLKEHFGPITPGGDYLGVVGTDKRLASEVAKKLYNTFTPGEIQDLRLQYEYQGGENSGMDFNTYVLLEAASIAGLYEKDNVTIDNVRESPELQMAINRSKLEEPESVFDYPTATPYVGTTSSAADIIAKTESNDVRIAEIEELLRGQELLYNEDGSLREPEDVEAIKRDLVAERRALIEESSHLRQFDQQIRAETGFNPDNISEEEEEMLNTLAGQIPYRIHNGEFQTLQAMYSYADDHRGGVTRRVTRMVFRDTDRETYNAKKEEYKKLRDEAMKLLGPEATAYVDAYQQLAEHPDIISVGLYSEDFADDVETFFTDAIAGPGGEIALFYDNGDQVDIENYEDYSMVESNVGGVRFNPRDKVWEVAVRPKKPKIETGTDRELYDSKTVYLRLSNGRQVFNQMLQKRFPNYRVDGHPDQMAMYENQKNILLSERMYDNYNPSTSSSRFSVKDLMTDGSNVEVEVRRIVPTLRPKYNNKNYIIRIYKNGTVVESHLTNQVGDLGSFIK